MKQELAEQIGYQALAWLAGQDELWSVFLGSTGASLEDIKRDAQSLEFIGSVLDFVMMDDAWVVAFCDEVKISYDTPMRARGALPGGEAVHWT